MWPAPVADRVVSAVDILPTFRGRTATWYSSEGMGVGSADVTSVCGEVGFTFLELVRHVGTTLLLTHSLTGSDRGDFWASPVVEILISVLLSDRLHVHIPPAFLYQIGVYSTNSSKMIGNFPAVLNFNRFICN